MNRATLSAFALTILAGCPANNTNPAVLWLAPDQAETRVKLVEDEPHSY